MGSCASRKREIQIYRFKLAMKVYASGTFDVRYHETLDFFRITGALRCKANNFFGYDIN